MDLTNIIKSIPYNYVVGEKSSKSLPVNVTLILDPDFKKTIFKGIAILGGSIILSVAINSAIKKYNR